MSQELVTLTNTEKQEKGESLAAKIGELYTIRAEKKSAMNEFKSQIDELEKEISEMSITLRTGRELRSRTFFDNSSLNADEEE